MAALDWLLLLLLAVSQVALICGILNALFFPADSDADLAQSFDARKKQ